MVTKNYFTALEKQHKSYFSCFCLEQPEQWKLLLVFVLWGCLLLLTLWSLPDWGKKKRTEGREGRRQRGTVEGREGRRQRGCGTYLIGVERREQKEERAEREHGRASRVAGTGGPQEAGRWSWGWERL
jgi:hypothetical protein